MSETEEVEILLVEDNPNDAELTIRALRQNNLANHLVHVKDGVEALDFVFGTGSFAKRGGVSSPKLILLDLKLPKVNGLEVLQKIKADAAKRLIPIVVLTSSKDEQDIAKSYALGVNSYIVKPIEFENFARAVKELGLYWLLMNRPPQ